MKEKKGGTPPGAMWAYGYEITPPIGREQLSSIESLIEEGHSTAKLGARMWHGRLVTEEQVTHILIVSDSPDQDLEVNRRLEAEFKRLEAATAITAPLEIEGPA